MKNMVVSLALTLGSVSAFAQTAEVCSVKRDGQITRIVFQADGGHATMSVDGGILNFEIVSKKAISGLKSLSAIAGEHVTQATQYVLSAPQGTNTIVLAKSASGDHMIFPGTGVLGASTRNCGSSTTPPIPQ